MSPLFAVDVSSRIAFQGELGSNGHELCRTEFPALEPRPCVTFADAFAGHCQSKCT